MSFSFGITGTKKGVLRELDKTEGYGDTSQFEAAKAFVKSEVEALPDDFTGLIAVSANGHHDNRSRNVTIKVEPNWTRIALDEEPENAL